MKKLMKKINEKIEHLNINRRQQKATQSKLATNSRLSIQNINNWRVCVRKIKYIT